MKKIVVLLFTLQIGCVPFRQINASSQYFSDESIKVSLDIGAGGGCWAPANLENTMRISAEPNPTNTAPITVSQIIINLSTKQIKKTYSNIYGNKNLEAKDPKLPPFVLSNSDSWYGFLSGKLSEITISNLSKGDTLILDFSIFYSRSNTAEYIFSKSATNIIIERTNSKGYLEPCYY